MKQADELTQRLDTIQESLTRLQQEISTLLQLQRQSEKEWLTVEEAGQRLSYSRNQVYELIHSNRGFPHVQLWERGEYRIPVKAFEEWADRQLQWSNNSNQQNVA